MSAVRGSARLALAAALPASALLAFAGRDGWIAFAVWLLGCVAVALAWHQPGRTPPLTRREWSGLVAVSALAAWFRLHQLYALPYGFPIDEARVAQRSVQILDAAFAPFGSTPLLASREDYVRIPNLYLYFCAALQWLGGFGRLGAKLISVVPGIAAVPLLFVFARAWLRPPYALLAAGFLAVSTWHIGLSRWGWEQVLSTALCVATFAGVERALARSRLAPAAWAGLAAGLSLYADESARLAWAAAAGVLALEVALRRDAFAARALGVFGLGTLAAALPLFAGWLRDPAQFGARLGEVWLGAAPGDAAPLGRSLAAHLGMFHFAGDPHPRHHPAGGPMLHLAVGALFALGVGLALARLRRPDARVCLAWLGVGLLGGILAQSTLLPHAYRTGLVAPVCCALAAAGAQWLADRTRMGSAARRGVGVALLGAFALAAVGAWRDLFVGAQQSGAAWRGAGRGAAARRIGDALAERLPPDGVAYLDRGLRRVELGAELARFGPARAWWRVGRSGERPRTLLWLDDVSPEALRFALSAPSATRIYVAEPGADLQIGGSVRVEELFAPGGAPAARLAIAAPDAPSPCGLRLRFAPGARFGAGLADPDAGSRLPADARETRARAAALGADARPAAGVFSGEWTGWLEIAQPGAYRFALESDARAALRLAGQALEIETPGRARQREARFDLARGRHPLALRVEAEAASSALALRWAPPQEPWSALPCGLLRPALPEAGARPEEPAPQPRAGSETPR